MGRNVLIAEHAAKTDEHTLLVGRSHLDEGINILMPALSNWEGNALVYDPTGKAWSTTWRDRAANLGQKVRKFDLGRAAERGIVPFNPLLEVRVGTKHEQHDSRFIADILFDPSGFHQRPGLEEHGEQAFSLLWKSIVHVCREAHAKGQVPQISDVAAHLTRPDEKSIYSVLNEHSDLYDLNFQMGSLYRMPMQTPEALSNILSMARAAIGNYMPRNDALSAEQMANWSISDLVGEDRGPSTIYLTGNSGEIGGRGHDVSITSIMIIALVISRLTETWAYKSAPPAPKENFLLFLNEFPTLGPMKIIEDAFAYMHHFGVKAILTAWGTEEIESLYGPRSNVLGECNIFVPGFNDIMNEWGEKIAETEENEAVNA